MARRKNRARFCGLRTSAKALGVCALISVACGAEEDEPRTGMLLIPALEGDRLTGDDVATGACEAGDIRYCLVHIDEHNCFEGRQFCIEGAWSHCDEGPD